MRRPGSLPMHIDRQGAKFRLKKANVGSACFTARWLFQMYLLLHPTAPPTNQKLRSADLSGRSARSSYVRLPSQIPTQADIRHA